MTVAMVPRDQLQACEAANRMLRGELSRVEGERDAAVAALRYIAAEDEGDDYDLPDLALLTDLFFAGAFRAPAVARAALAVETL